VHSSRVFSAFLAKQGIILLFHLPYSPDLEPVDFIIFPKLKIAMKGTTFEAVSSFQQTVMRDVKAIMEEAFSWSFSPLYERCKVNIVQKCVGTVLSYGINK
jgi:hypothetical protein